MQEQKNCFIKPTINFIKLDSEYHIVNHPDQLTKKDYELLIYPHNDIIYLLNGEWHRENAPAVIYTYGYRAWLIHDK